MYHFLGSTSEVLQTASVISSDSSRSESLEHAWIVAEPVSHWVSKVSGVFTALSLQQRLQSLITNIQPPTLTSSILLLQKHLIIHASSASADCDVIYYYFNSCLFCASSASADYDVIFPVDYSMHRLLLALNLGLSTRWARYQVCGCELWLIRTRTFRQLLLDTRSFSWWTRFETIVDIQI